MLLRLSLIRNFVTARNQWIAHVLTVSSLDTKTMATMVCRYRCAHLLKHIGILANQQGLISQNVCKVTGVHTENLLCESEDKHRSSADDSESNTRVLHAQSSDGLKMRDFRRKHSLSPTARLMSALPEAYTRDCMDNVSSKNEKSAKPNETTAEANSTKGSVGYLRASSSGNTGMLEVNEEYNKSRARNQSDIEVDGRLTHRYLRGRKSSIQPATRLSGLLPKEYWQSVGDTDTKQIIDDISDTGQKAYKDK